MKKLIISAAFATLLASPAFAQSYNPEVGTANVGSPAAEMNGGRDMAMPSYPDAATQTASAEHLEGVRAEAPKPKRRHTQPAIQH
ncbi:MAG TPA: hypothetical protein VHT93_20520 [Pseudolabrys sp.]|jgi:hypothetical protein|nr:hypothetical protein [Pseudolabrys sp.]